MRGEKKIFTDINRGGRLKPIEKREENGSFWGKKKKSTHWMLTGWLLWAPAPGSVWPAERCAAAGRCSAAAASAPGPRRQSGRSLPPTAAPEEHGPEHNNTHAVKKKTPLHKRGFFQSVIYCPEVWRTLSSKGKHWTKLSESIWISVIRDLYPQPYRRPASPLTHRAVIAEDCSWDSN